MKYTSAYVQEMWIDENGNIMPVDYKTPKYKSFFSVYLKGENGLSSIVGDFKESEYAYEVCHLINKGINKR